MTRHCAEPGCTFAGDGLDLFCPVHFDSLEAADQVSQLALIDTTPPPEIVPLPCTRCSSSMGIQYAETLCHACQVDLRRAQRSDYDNPTAAGKGVGSHVANTLPEDDR